MYGESLNYCGVRQLATDELLASALFFNVSWDTHQPTYRLLCKIEQEQVLQDKPNDS
jgi:hypothetical protein